MEVHKELTISFRGNSTSRLVCLYRAELGAALNEFLFIIITLIPVFTFVVRVIVPLLNDQSKFSDIDSSLQAGVVSTNGDVLTFQGEGAAIVSDGAPVSQLQLSIGAERLYRNQSDSNQLFCISLLSKRYNLTNCLPENQTIEIASGAAGVGISGSAPCPIPLPSLCRDLVGDLEDISPSTNCQSVYYLALYRRGSASCILTTPNLHLGNIPAGIVLTGGATPIPTMTPVPTPTFSPLPIPSLPPTPVPTPIVEPIPTPPIFAVPSPTEPPPIGIPTSAPTSYITPVPTPSTQDPVITVPTPPPPPPPAPTPPIFPTDGGDTFNSDTGFFD